MTDSIVPRVLYLRRPVEAQFCYAVTPIGIRACYRDQHGINTTTIAGKWERVEAEPQWPPAPAQPAYAIIRRAGTPATALGGYALPWRQVEHAMHPLCDVCGRTLGNPATLLVRRKLIGYEHREWRLHSELCPGCAAAVPHRLIGTINKDGSIKKVKA